RACSSPPLRSCRLRLLSVSERPERTPMKFCPAILLGLLSLPFPVCRAGIPTPFFTIEGDKGVARVDHGKLSLGKRSYKVPVEDKAPDKWYLDGTRIKCSVGKHYLAYDTSGQDPKVFLVSEPGEKTEWEIVIHRACCPGGEKVTVRA